MPFSPPFDPSEMAFGRKDGKYAHTSVNDAIIRFKIGGTEAPLRVPFGISDPYNVEASERLTMDLELNDPEALHFFRQTDQAVVDAAMKNSKQWFGKQLNEAAIRAMHTPLVKDAKDQKYNPTLRTKVNVGSVRPTSIYVYKGPKSAKTGSKRDVGRGSFVSPYVSLSSVMFGNKQFGVSMTCEQLMVVPSAKEDGPSIFGDFELQDDEQPQKKKAKTKTNEEASDSDYVSDNE